MSTQEEKLGISTAPLIVIGLFYIVVVVIVDVAVIAVVVNARKTRESWKASCPLLSSRRRWTSSSCSRTTTTRCARSSASATRSADRLPIPPTEKHCNKTTNHARREDFSFYPKQDQGRKMRGCGCFHWDGKLEEKALRSKWQQR